MAHSFTLVQLHKHPLFLQQIPHLLLFLIPFCLLFWTTGIWLIQALLLLTWLLGRHAQQRHYAQHVRVLKSDPLANYSLVVVLGYVLWSGCSVLLLHSPLQSIDNGLIFLLWCLMLPVLVDLKPNYQFLAYGCFIALVLALLLALTQFHILNLKRAFGLYGNGQTGSGAIKFGDMALLFGMLTQVLLAQTRYRLLGILGLLLGVLICLYASSRGGLFAIGLCIVIALLNQARYRLPGLKMAGFLAVGGFALYLLNSLMHDFLLARLQETKDEFALILALKFSTPIGIRLHLWYAAFMMFLEHPWLGVGINNFAKALKGLQHAGGLSNEALRYAHAHNEYLCALATGGIVGFVLTLLLFILPIRLFWQDYHTNVWAKAGFWSVCLMSFFALTDCVFDRRMTVMAFIVMVSLCMAGNLRFKADKLC